MPLGSLLADPSAPLTAHTAFTEWQFAPVVTVGVATYVNPLVRLPLWPFSVTVTVTAPAAPAGVVAVIEVLLTTVTFVAAAEPNVTVAPEEKLVPVIVTDVPPAVDPVLGLTPVTVGLTT